jgi:hypothetical protein
MNEIEPWRRDMRDHNAYATTIETSERPRDRDWLGAAVGVAALLLALSLILFALSAFAGIQAMRSHKAATLELNTTLRQLHLKNELAISEMEHREPRLQPSESPLPE